ncbi:MAG: hypothetical protein VYA30_08565, partial [Myxococcota bacterium]|nr:hypothetical protein [Myxococcota bacterium]
NDVRLTLSRYAELANLLAPPTGKEDGALASLIGQKSSVAQRRAQGIIQRKRVDGFIGFFEAPKFGTRDLKCKIELKNGRVFRLQFKLDTLGWSKRKKALNTLLTLGWGSPRSSSTGTLFWRKRGVELTMETLRPGPERPAEPVLMLTLTQSSHPATPESATQAP